MTRNVEENAILLNAICKKDDKDLTSVDTNEDFTRLIGKDVKDKDIIIVDDMIASGESMIDVARELKKRGANQIFMMSAYSLFTKGLEVFDKAYEEGLFTRVYTTNLSYVPEEALERPWLHQADCSGYVAKIIYTFYMGQSVAPILEYRSKILEDFAKK